MADLTDVENAIVSLIDAALYPNGDGNPSVTGDTIKIYPGWPNAAQLDKDVAAGVVNISVFPPPGTERNTTRYLRDDIEVAAPTHTLTAAVSDNTVTIDGAVSVPQNVIVLCGTRFAFPYAVQAGDTLSSIAAALAGMIAAAFPATASAGPVVTIAGSPGLVRARIAGQGLVYTEQRRQDRLFDVSIWASSPDQRTRVAKVVDPAFAQVDFLTLVDDSAARIIYQSSAELDEAQKVTIYRRCLKFMVEYATSTITPAYEVGAVGLTVAGSPQPTYL